MKLILRIEQNMGESPKSSCIIKRCVFFQMYILVIFHHIKMIENTANLGVSENGGTPKIIQFNRDFHDKSSILGFSPYFWKHAFAP